ncbi:MAG TPA: hypothetical protein VFU23_02940 [Gemmatimonadales bacterium]|nr:hypothetical protein [Gemmatimonadales bacterium]
MTHPSIFRIIFEPPAEAAYALLRIDPEKIAKDTTLKEAAAWRLLLGSIALRRINERPPADDWLNYATRLESPNDLFKAELLGEAGKVLLERGRVMDAYEVLNTALAIWRDLCNDALDACQAGVPEKMAALTANLQALYRAGGVEAPAPRPATPELQMWLEERAVLARAATAANFLRVLCNIGMADGAGKVCGDEIEWVSRHFTAPPSALPFEKRAMTPPVRAALYDLLLARGDVTLAEGSAEASAEAYAQAAALYQGHADEAGDITRRIRARLHQADSLLCLERHAEAVVIYQLCLEGFHALGDELGAHHVREALLVTQIKAGDDEPQGSVP